MSKLLPIDTINPLDTPAVVHINALLVTYAQNQTALAGLEAIKTDMLGKIDNAADCPQCQANGKVDTDANGAAGAWVCPLCGGMTKTSGQYKLNVIVTGYGPTS